MELRTFKLILSTFSDISNFTTDTDALQSKGPYQTAVVVIIVLVTGSLSFVTMTGNILVMLSIIFNKNLQTINNYFLFSLACADLMMGATAMNLFTVYNVYEYWPLGPAVCNLWLILDCVISGASNLHLLIISFDRYFCITKPLTYPSKRTPRMACMIIAAAWSIAFILWAPAILLWQVIVGERTVPEDECYVQFLSNPIVMFIVTLATFYVPVAIMMVLYWQISRASKSTVKKGKHNPKQDNPSNNKAGNHITLPCDDDAVKTHHAERNLNSRTDDVGEEELSAPVHPEGNEIAEAPAGYEGNPTAHGQNATMAKKQPKKKTLPSREKRVTRTVMAILAAFMVMWSPYGVIVLIVTFCSTCVPSSMWMLSIWFVYINSLINPACYALCNATFKKTFKQLLLCQHKDIRLGR